MKQKYVSPKVNIHHITPATIICTSFDTNNAKVGNAASMAASREGYDCWNEDEE